MWTSALHASEDYFHMLRTRHLAHTQTAHRVHAGNCCALPYGLAHRLDSRVPSSPSSAAPDHRPVGGHRVLRVAVLRPRQERTRGDTSNQAHPPGAAHRFEAGVAGPAQPECDSDVGAGRPRNQGTWPHLALAPVPVAPDAMPEWPRPESRRRQPGVLSFTRTAATCLLRRPSRLSLPAAPGISGAYYEGPPCASASSATELVAGVRSPEGLGWLTRQRSLIRRAAIFDAGGWEQPSRWPPLGPGPCAVRQRSPGLASSGSAATFPPALSTAQLRAPPRQHPLLSGFSQST